MKTMPLPEQRAYIARMALDLGATLIAYGSTRAEARLTASSSERNWRRGSGSTHPPR